MTGKKSKTGFEKHLVSCQYCGKDILDHMTQCPFCKATISPAAYQPMNPEKQRKIKIALTVVLCVAAGVLLLFVKCGK